MDAAAFLCIGFVGLLAFAPLIWLIARAIKAKDELEKLTLRIKLLEHALKTQAHASMPTELTETFTPAIIRPKVETQAPLAQPKPVPVSDMETAKARAALDRAPVNIEPPKISIDLSPAHIPAVALTEPTTHVSPPHVVVRPAPAPKIESPRPAINWEKFLGVNMFSWIGGLALFLGAVFFIKYAFENNLVRPEIRIALGYALGIGLMVGSLRMSLDKQKVTIQTLCATGTVILYANTYAAHTYYNFIGSGVTFGVMALTTAVAFFLAVRLDAQVVAILGLLGGFLTPLMVSTGQDNPQGLFTYLALLDIGLIAVALRMRWNYLFLLAAAATGFMQMGWIGEFFTPEKVFTGMAIFGGFSVLFTGGLAVAERRKQCDRNVVGASVFMSTLGLFTAFFFADKARAIVSPTVLFGYIFWIDVCVLAIAWLHAESRWVLAWAGGWVFLFLATWTATYLKPEHLNVALGAYFVFATLHSVYPLVLQRLRPAPTPMWTAHLFPMLALGLIVLPVINIPEISWVVWPVVLLIDVLAIGLAVFTASLFSILAVFVLTIAVIALWIAQIPVGNAGANVDSELLVVGLFAVVFMLGIVWAGNKVRAGMTAAMGGLSSGATTSVQMSNDSFAQLASLSAMMPFLLLVLVLQQTKMSDPSRVFGLAMAMSVMLLAVVRFCKTDILAPIALFCALMVEYVWQLQWFSSDRFGSALGWLLSFGALFLVYPFIFMDEFKARVPQWVASALSLPLHFYMIHRTFHVAMPGFEYLGLVTALLAVPSLIGLAVLVRKLDITIPNRNTLLALFGGSTLFFVTLVFPIQFERQWLTVGWALEGVALLWLLRRVPHDGLRWVGFLLLLVSFGRLGMNPFVISEYGRSGTPIFNWYLYTYGIVTACLLGGGAMLSQPSQIALSGKKPVTLYALGIILAFLLVNIEIADYFSKPGPLLTVDFNSTFAQDMAYSLCWAVFSFGLLAIGFMRKNAPVRYAGMGLMVMTITKLFLHDLWQLGGLYRIGSLVALAVLLMLISYSYQRFLAKPVDAPAKSSDAS